MSPPSLPLPLGVGSRWLSMALPWRRACVAWRRRRHPLLGRRLPRRSTAPPQTPRRGAMARAHGVGIVAVVLALVGRHGPSDECWGKGRARGGGLLTRLDGGRGEHHGGCGKKGKISLHHVLGDARYFTQAAPRVKIRRCSRTG